jgi:Fic family protein
MVTIREIKKSSKSYYYLEHTLRNGETFSNKRLYLGTKLPKNLPIIRQEFVYELFTQKFKKELDSIKKKFSKEFSSYPKIAKKNYFEYFMIKFTYNSNRIEGNTLSLSETADLLQEGISPAHKPIRDIKEAESHKNVFYDVLNYEKDLSFSVILKWHKDLLLTIEPEIAGKIRNHPVGIARSKVELPLPVEISALLNDFFKWYNKYKSTLHPVILAGLIHLKFVTIHPFSDGNGRISRLMMNFILHKHGFPMMNIFYSNRIAYYNALERSQINNKEEIFLSYFLNRYVKNQN